MAPDHKEGVAIVTGSGRGIGRAIAENLISNGYTVVALDKDANLLEDLPKNPRLYLYAVDVGKPEEVQNVLTKITSNLGTPVILVNNAGVGGPFHKIDQVSDEEWNWIIDTNLRSVFMFSRFCIPLMAAKSFGRIVNIASIQGQFGAVTSSTYSASKHGVIGYTRSIAAEWGHAGITANAVCPGYISTNMGTQDDKVDSHTTKVIARTPTRNLGTPAQVASLVEFLVRQSSGYINGSSINIDGGISADVGV